MFSPRYLYGFLPLLAVAALAKPGKDAVEPAKVEARESLRDKEVLQRRTTLRASLKSQPEAAPAREPSNSSVRSLSVQERADLRQQLRQQ